MQFRTELYDFSESFMIKWTSEHANDAIERKATKQSSDFSKAELYYIFNDPPRPSKQDTPKCQTHCIIMRRSIGKRTKKMMKNVFAII